MIKKKIDSRHLQLDMEKCVKNVDNLRYDMVLVAAERLRELKKQHRHGKHQSTIDALLEIQNGEVDAGAYLLKMDTRSQTLGG
jgi:DNA-directed RNA polymerase subunit K/omega